MPETSDEIYNRYQQKYPYISKGRALALNQGENRYRHLLVAAQKKLTEQRREKQEQLRQQLFGEP
jgi:hypothetical protein